MPWGLSVSRAPLLLPDHPAERTTMRELELDGIHDDGEHVVLIDSDGDRYTLRITEALRAAVRRDRPALGALQAADSAPLRPREIQALLRSGRSAEDIAELAQVPVEHVRRYEGPVIAEREWTAQRARSFSVGRGGPALEDVVADRLAARLASSDTAWDAWRRQDGSWTLELTFSAGGRTRQAHWQVQLEARSVTALDDEARWMSDDDAPRDEPRPRARLTAIRSRVYDVEADGSFENTPPRGDGHAPRPLHPSAGRHPSAIDEADLDALNARRGLRPVPSDSSDSAEGVWSSLEDDGSPGADVEAREEHRREQDDDRSSGIIDPDQDPALEADDAEPETSPSPQQPDMDADPDSDVDAADDADDASGNDEVHTQETVDLTPLPGFDSPDDSTEEADNEAKASAKRKSKRASMPSWDEIVFGPKHD